MLFLERKRIPMAHIKYIRVSTQEQNTARQEQDLKQFDKVYIEKASGKNTDRPQLHAMLDYVREGDIVEVESYSRIARNTKDLLSIVEMLEKKGVEIISQKEKIDTSTPQGRLMLTIFAGLAQFERECTLERQAEGIAIAKTEGRMGRPCVVPADNFAHIVADWQEGKITAVEAMRKAQLSKATFYRKVKEYETDKK
jgi:DNA invertase Pin-like site-specific DNA recombinase